MSVDTKRILHRLAPILRDPLTGDVLRQDGEQFVSYGHVYPIVNGIPRFVASDLYVGSFSFEWNLHSKTQLDCYSGNTSSEQEFCEKTGFTPDDLRGKLVLDAGVGAGRYADVISRWGTDVVGVDLSFAVEAAARNVGDRENVWIAQADIGRLPFAPGTFDAIFSIGVLHHTPSTKEYFLRLVPLLKPGGTIAIWVYPKERDYLIRQQWVPFVNKVPVRMFYTWCRWFVPWAEAHLTNPWVGAIHRIFPFPTHRLGIEHDILDTFDGYSPRYHGTHSPEEVQKWFKEAGLVKIYSPNMTRWNTCMRGEKPT